MTAFLPKKDQSVSRSVCVIACGFEVVDAFAGREGRDKRADGLPESFDGPLGLSEHQGLELGESQFPIADVAADQVRSSTMS
ncbi:hypothetical protein M673_04240 [Aureimonas sp. AU20]|nr:hypothetical protein [Aureimonas sp. AU20]ALN71913.1 hypothetical protein M673_04240 [Aureimonas sp. AU20]